MPLAVFLAFFLSCSCRTNGQQPASTTTTTLVRDPQALAIAQQSLASMGGTQTALPQDSVATGQVQIFKPDGTSTVFPITKKSKGNTMVRTEVQKPQGTQVRVVNGGIGGVQNPDGTTRHQFSNNTVGERIEHIPALSLLSEIASSNIEVRYVGTDTVNGSPANVISVSLIPTSDPRWVDLYRSTTQTLFYIDLATNLVSKIQYQNFAENDSNVSERVEVFFSDYRLVNGVQVPFKQASYADGTLRSTLTFSSVAFDTGLMDSQFAVPGAN